MDGEAADCAREAATAEAPFVVELAFPGAAPQRQPALVGAHFGGRYQLRTYVSRTDQVGERTPVELVVPQPGSEALATMATQLRPLRCQMSAKPPEGGTWELVEGRPHARRDVEACREWFDEGAWHRSPWASTYDEGAVLDCAVSVR